jgi:hypothetical protein
MGSSPQPRERIVGLLVGYRYANGEVACVDCDCFPPDAEDIRTAGGRAPNLKCDACGQALSEVRPVGSRP